MNRKELLSPESPGVPTGEQAEFSRFSEPTGPHLQEHELGAAVIRFRQHHRAAIRSTAALGDRGARPASKFPRDLGHHIREISLVRAGKMVQRVRRLPDSSLDPNTTYDLLASHQK